MQAMDAGYESLVGALLVVPSETRAFTLDTTAAGRIYGVEPRMLDELVRVGLPCGESDGRRWYSNGDLHYVGLRLGTAVVQLRAFESWLDRLTGKAGVDRTQLRIRYVPRLPDGADGSSGSVLLPDGRVPVTLYNNRPAAEILTRPRWQWPAIDRPVADLLDEVAASTDTYLFDIRDAVSRDTYSGNVGDCSLAAEVVFDRCQELGYETRSSFGVIAAPMFSLPHVWTEIRLAGVWVPVDSMVLGLLRRFQQLDHTQWPATGSVGGLLLRLADQWEPIIADAEYSLFTTAG
jgi:hypothetical protein